MFASSSTLSNVSINFAARRRHKRKLSGPFFWALDRFFWATRFL